MPLTTSITVAALLVALLSLTASTLLARRVLRLERAGAGRVTPLPRTAEGLTRELDGLRAAVAQAQAEVATSLRHVAVVRYDAFDDLAGRLSFSAALLDDAGDGVVLTAINGRSETRSYAKGVSGGRSTHPLSPEEKEALAKARAPRPAPALERAG